MIGLDWVLIVMVLIITGVQTYRGLKDFDVVLYEMVSFILSAVISLKWYGALSDMVNVSPHLALLFLYVIVEIVLLIFANILATRTEFSWEPFNGFLSFFFGLVTSWTILHVLLKIGNLDAGGKFPLFNQTTIGKSVIAQEILQLKFVHAIWGFLNKVGSGG